MWSSLLDGRTNGHKTSTQIKSKERMAYWHSSCDTLADETSSLVCFPVCSPEHMFCHQQPCGLTQLSSEATDNDSGGRDGRTEDAQWRGLPTSCFPHCGLCGNTLVVMGASVSMQISVCYPSVCVCHVQSSARVCFPENQGFAKSEAKGQSGIKVGIILATNLLIKGCFFLYQ